jgi:hypothetical protein
MLVSVLGSHLVAAFVGVGMSVLFFGCAKVASQMNARALAASTLVALAWHSSRVVLGLVCAAPMAFSSLYLLLDLRIPVTVVVSLLVGLFASSYLFVKFRLFGGIALARPHPRHAA